MQMCIQNFKGYRDSEWFEIKPITLVYGQNGAGKSAIIESILLSEKIFGLLMGFERPSFDTSANARVDLKFNSTYLDLGDFESCVYGKNKSEKIKFAYRINAPLIAEGQYSKVEVSADISFPGNVTRFGIKLVDITLSQFLDLARSEYPFLYELPDAFHDSFDYEKPLTIAFDYVRVDAGWVLTSSHIIDQVFESLPGDIQEFFENPETSKYRYELRIGEGPFDTNITTRYDSEEESKRRAFRPLEFDDEKKHFPTFFGGVAHRVTKYLHQNFFADPIHLPAYRGNPRRLFEVTKGTPDPVQWSAVLLSTDKYRKKLVVEALKKIGVYEGTLKTPARKDLGTTQVKTYFEKTISELDHPIKLSLSDLGFGVSQVLPTLVAMSEPQGNKFPRYCRLLCIEEPESHLHPALQGNLIQLVAEQSLANTRVFSPYSELGDHEYSVSLVKKNPSQMKRYVIETHSENFLKRLQKLIMSGKVASEGVSILFCKCDEELGPFVSDLGIGSDGSLLSPWPNDYLELPWNDGQ